MFLLLLASYLQIMILLKISVIFNVSNQPDFMKITIIFSLLALLYTGANAQQVTHLKKAAVPAAMKYHGPFTDAIRYQDKEGTHVVIITQDVTAQPADDDESVYTGILHAWSYLQSGNSVQLSWQLNDNAGPCGGDVDVKFRPGSLSVTDLDHNGLAEVWLVYRVSCHGFQTPSPMKVIMHEGAQKYAMRGTTKLKLKVTPVQYKGGDYVFDEVFNAAPQTFRDYAKGLWVKNWDEVALY